MPHAPINAVFCWDSCRDTAMSALSPWHCWRAATAQALRAGNCPVLGRASTAAASPPLQNPTLASHQGLEPPQHPSCSSARARLAGLRWLPQPSLLHAPPLKGVPALFPTFLGSPPGAAFGVWGLGFTTMWKGRVGAASLHQQDQAPGSHPATHAFPAAFSFSPYLCRLTHFAAPSELFQSANWC